MLIIYHKDGTKTVTDKKISRYYDASNIPFHDRMLRSYYQLECQHKLHPNHLGAKGNKIKRTWEMERYRYDAGLSD